MKPVRIVILAVAAVAAVGLAVIVRGALSGKATSQASAAVPISQPVKPMARVLVAKRDLKVGDRLTEADMDWQEWPADAVNQAFVTDGSVDVANPLGDPAEPEEAEDGKDAKAKDAKDKGAKSKDKADKDDKSGKDAKGKDAKAKTAAAKPEQPVEKVARTVAMLGDPGPKAQFLGAVVREPFLAGEPIVARKVVRAGESGIMAVVLQPGMRAMAIPVTVETAAGGFILPGDRVDVVLARETEVQSGGSTRNAFISETVLRNVKVLAIDQVTQPDKDATSVVGATATVELMAADAELLALAKARGTLSLTLRSYADAGGPSGRPADAGIAPSAGGMAEVTSVRVFRGGEVSDVAVN